MYSDTAGPTVWDLELSKMLNPWFVEPRKDGSVGKGAFQDRGFPSETDSFFVRAAIEQAAATRLSVVQPVPLPDRDFLVALDPYPDSSSGDLNMWLVVGPLAAAAVLGLVAVVVVLRVRRHRAMQRTNEASPLEPHEQARKFSSIGEEVLLQVICVSCLVSFCRAW